MCNQVAELQAANKAAMRRKSHKRKRVQEEGALTVEDGFQQTTLKEFGAHRNGTKAKKRARVEVGKPSQRRCGRCGEAGNNSHTCRQEVAMDSELKSVLQFSITVCDSVILLCRVVALVGSWQSDQLASAISSLVRYVTGGNNRACTSCT
jgi:hypothetical protein